MNTVNQTNDINCKSKIYESRSLTYYLGEKYGDDCKGTYGHQDLIPYIA